MTHPEFIVVGGGLVGMSIAYGLQRRNVQTLVVDEGDNAFRASRGNFGLIWTQSKGINMPAYANWTWESAERWRAFNTELVTQTGVKLAYERPGGLEICLGEAEMSSKQAKMERLQSHADHIEFRMLERKALGNMLPGLGPDVVGGCLSSGDGHVNPLALLRALHAGFQAKGGQVFSGSNVRDIECSSSVFQVRTSANCFESGRVVVAAGLGTPRLAKMLGMEVDVRPQRGQNLITERVKPFLSMPMSTIRQTAEGGVQLGDSKEEVGFNDGVTSATMAEISDRAIRVFPNLKHTRVVRAWGALRVMSADGAPIYAQSKSCPGAYAAVCHSGVTLAAVHADVLAPSLAKNHLPVSAEALGPERFADG
ncbi:NAD(P)/FAD-dependent oxidoreductase [Pseudopelagicola sp. nBUS_19]|uniref:NAD(P)/FAD-dependent oxidoreductase n=1 Tax=unclassified Pseudopelagicola TaxID=2649563 RepID=UPI003EBA8470